MKIELDILAGDALHNDLMHCADTFEKGKQLVQNLKSYTPVVMEVADNIDLSHIISILKVSLEKAKKSVVFIAVRTVNGIREKNPNVYFMPKVQSVSDGSGWILFRDILAQLGYKVETDQHMHVISVKF